MEYEVTEFTENTKPVVKKLVYKYRGFQSFISSLSSFKKEKFSNFKAVTPSRLSFLCPVHGTVTQQKTSFLEYAEGCYHCRGLEGKFELFKEFSSSYSKELKPLVLIFNKDFPKYVTFREGGKKKKLTMKKFLLSFTKQSSKDVKKEPSDRCVERFEAVVEKATQIYGNKFFYPLHDNLELSKKPHTLTIICHKHGKYKRDVYAHTSKSNIGTRLTGGCKGCFSEMMSEGMFKRYRLKKENGEK